MLLLRQRLGQRCRQRLPGLRPLPKLLPPAVGGLGWQRRRRLCWLLLALLLPPLPFCSWRRACRGLLLLLRRWQRCGCPLPLAPPLASCSQQLSSF